MQNLDEIADRIRQSFEARTAARDKALSQSRSLTRACSIAIRAVHRDETDVAQQNVSAARQLVETIQADLSEYPDLYHAVYTQDALKEFAEAEIVFALIRDKPLPTPEALGLEYATYLKGMAEASGELRRRCLDILRHGYSDEVERLLGLMDDIYLILVTMDYPDAITGGLRRLTDVVRGVNERTRGDITLSLRQQHLEESLHLLQDKLADQG